MTAFPRALIHKIEYKSQWDSNPEHWHVSDEILFLNIKTIIILCLYLFLTVCKCNRNL